MRTRPPSHSCVHLLALIACLCLFSVLLPVDAQAEELEPTMSSNAWANDYSMYGTRSKSALTTDGSGNLQRVEYIDERLVVETYQYRDAYQVTAQRTIDASTYAPSTLGSARSVRWGGFFGGADANYVVTGQSNHEEDKSLPVVRVTKYSKNWDYLGNCEYRDINTTVPFDAGSCSMTEVSGRLYIKTCHEMNRTSDGFNHQASMSFVIDESDMRPVATYVQIGGGGGYTSHSFYQCLTVLGSSVYSVDLGDAYPRMVAVRNLTTAPDYGQRSCAIEIKGGLGDNGTYTTVGGIAASQASNTVLTVGTQRDQDKVYTGGASKCPRNVWLAVTEADLSSSKRIALTTYAESSDTEATNPQIVKVGDDEFLVLWGVSPAQSQPRYDGKTHTVAYAFVNGRGEVTKGVQTSDGCLSDCQPVVKDGKVIWYASSITPGSYGEPQIPVFYRIDLASKTMIPTGNATRPMYRLYNRWSGEHLFTASRNEYNSLAIIGWNQEGTAWRSPATGEIVYRLYNPYSGDHFYTKDRTEYDHLGSIDWNQEGESFRSGGSKPIYRLFNKWLTQGTHLFTTDRAEYDKLCSIGWSGEGTAFYGE